jgi:hypothetical protein
VLERQARRKESGADSRGVIVGIRFDHAQRSAAGLTSGVWAVPGADHCYVIVD